MLQIFVSYAHKDGSKNSLRLERALQKKQIGVWRDTGMTHTIPWDNQIEQGIKKATHVVVLLTADLERADSFVRKEILCAIAEKKPIIPLMFPGGYLPLTIKNLNYIDFSNWRKGFVQLLKQLKNASTNEIDPKTPRERETAYLQSIARSFNHWTNTYTDLKATAQIEERKVKLKHAIDSTIIEVLITINKSDDPNFDPRKGIITKTENLEELRRGLRKYPRAVLIGDPGAGKTTTLERLAYEYASVAAQETTEPFQSQLPLFVSLATYTGQDFSAFLEASFGNLRLQDYLPERVILLLDGLNEMSPAHHHKIHKWLRDNPNVAVIVSCRKSDYVEALKLPLHLVEILPLDLERIRLFMGNYLEDEARNRLFWSLVGSDVQNVRKWYKQIRPDTDYQEFFIGEDKPGLDYEPERRMLEHLRKNYRENNYLPDMLGVVTNPFLLCIVIEIFATFGEVPSNKGVLLQHFITLVMEKRGKRAIRTGKPWVTEKTQRYVLATLAYQMQIEQTGTNVSRDYVVKTFHQTAPEENPELLLYFAVSSGILEQNDSVRFSHHLLQEYFAAYEMGEDILKRQAPATKYFPSEDWWVRTGWEETVLFLPDMLGETSWIFEWLIPVQPDLAYQIVTERNINIDTPSLKALFEPALGARRSPYAILEWGRQNHKTDRRPGVGVSANGLPNIAWCKISPGEFLYGDENQERQISYEFRIAKYPVTFIQFQTFIDSGEFDDPRWWKDFPTFIDAHKLDNPLFVKADFRDIYHPQPMAKQNNPYNNHPRDMVSWYQAVAFSNWLDVKYREAKGIADHLQIRLPVEAEWEYAARGHDGREYPWGNEYRGGYANIDERQREIGRYFLYQTTAVGLYPQGASPFGVLDMCGNVWEWCLNDFDYPEIITGFSNKRRKVIRGKCFLDPQPKVTYRRSLHPQHRDYFYGLRLVLGPRLYNFES